MDARVLSVISLIKMDHQREFTLHSLAQSVSLSPSRLRHVFKSETGISPTRYLHLHRMEAAKLRLETTFLTVKEIMFSVGLRDASHFVRDFKRDFGSTPTQYRRHAFVLHSLAASPHSHFGKQTDTFAN